MPFLFNAVRLSDQPSEAIYVDYSNRKGTFETKHCHWAIVTKEEHMEGERGK